MRKVLGAILTALLFVACGGSNGKNGSPGQPGATGDTGESGQDAANRLIISLTAQDLLGTENDTTVTANFAGDVSSMDSILTGATITASYGRRKGVELVCNIKYAPAIMCKDLGNGVYRHYIFDGEEDGIISEGAVFIIAFDRELDWFACQHKLQSWINNAVGIDGAFFVYPYEYGGDDIIWPISFIFEAQKNVPITAFDDQGENAGLTLTMPAYTVVDVNGVGNVMTVINLWEDLNEDTQDEPQGVPFDANVHHQDLGSFDEDGIIAVDEVFHLEFTVPMDVESTEGAIKYRLEQALVWSNVEVLVVNFENTMFQVRVLDVDAVLGDDDIYTLTLEPWDVTSAAGITNTTDPITFDITDITVPYVITQDPDSISSQFPFDWESGVESDTLAIILDPEVDRTSNNQLVEGDILHFCFDQSMEDDEDYEAAILERLDAVVDGTGDLSVKYENPCVYLILDADQTIDISGDLLQLGILDTTRIFDDDIDLEIALAENQNPTATKSNWIVPAQIVDREELDAENLNPGNSNGLHVVTIADNPEDNIIEAGDTIGVLFDKVMDIDHTREALASIFSSTNPTGGTKGGDWSGIVYTDIIYNNIANGHTTLVDCYFTYTLTGDQTLEITGDSLSFGDLPNDPETVPVVTDYWGLYLAPDQELNVTLENFDPAVPPYLVSVVGTRKGIHCGNQLAEELDVIKFTFSEELSEESIDLLKVAIAEELNDLLEAAGATTNYLTAGDVVEIGPSIVTQLTVILDEDQYFDIAEPITFTFDVEDVVDVHGVEAEEATAVLQPFDTLTMELSFDPENIDNNIVQYDGLLIGGDSFSLTFSCVMDSHITLSAIQEGVDNLMGNGTACVERNPESNGSSTFLVEILPGRSFDVSEARTVLVEDVATAEEPFEPDTEFEIIPGSFSGSIADVMVPDVVLTYVSGSANGFEADFAATEALFSGQWYLSGVSEGISRHEAELPFVFSDFDIELP